MRLYEEAAWLYMQVGDNMLAIYASEKALRLAERLGEVRAASRAHGIFGRVFGRIGDTAKARENLERAIELAKDSDENETVLAMLALGHHLENAEGDYAAAERSYARGAGAGAAHRRRSRPDRAARGARAARLLPLRLGAGRPLQRRQRGARRTRGSGRQAVPVRTCCAGGCSWRDGDWEAAAELFRRARELAEQVGWSEVTFNALIGLAVTQRDRGDFADAEATIAQALDVCERAGLVGQSIQATSMRALMLALVGERRARRARPQSRLRSWPNASTTRSAKRPCSRRAA